MFSTTSALSAGARVGPYTLERPLGSGGSAQVFLGIDAEGNRHAIKARRVGMQSLDRRFLREFESMRALRVPGVVRVFEAGIAGEIIWFSMELVEGRPFLDAILENPDVSARVAKAMELGRQLFDILGDLHQAGFTHRDVKPTNVLVDERGQVRVLDFGIVRFFGDNDTNSESGTILGTVPYMAPEQLAGLPFDHRVDLYAAAIMLYEAIDGLRPSPQTTVAWIPRICLERLTPLASKRREVPRGLSNLLERLTEVQPRRRPGAIEAANRLRALQRGTDSGEWPEAPFVEIGDWISDLEGCIGNRALPPVVVLEGATGSGRSRVAEQLHRHAMLQGVWPVHASCRVEGCGAPLAELLEALLARDDDADRGAAFGADAEILRRMWPHLPLRAQPTGDALTSAVEVADAAARVIGQLAEHRPLLLIFHDLEQVDDLTSRAVHRLAALANDRLGLLLLHESRWESPRSRQLVHTLKQRYKAVVRAMPPITAEVARQIAAAICPQGTPPKTVAGSPLRAVEAALSALAAWRGERWIPPDVMLWPLVVRPKLPEPVFLRLSGSQGLAGQWAHRSDNDAMVQASGALARLSAGSRLADLRAAAGAVEAAWRAELGEDADDEQMATLRLLAGDPTGAWAPAVRAAATAEASGRYADARRWLLLVDTLPAEAAVKASASLRLDLAVVRARVALRTEAAAPRMTLVEAVDRLVTSADDDHTAKLLRAEYQLRNGEVRPALVNALRVASPTTLAQPESVVRALLVATHARFLLGQFEDAAPQLERARALLTENPEPRLEVQMMNWLSELAYRRGDLAGCRRTLQTSLRRAAETNYVRGAAFAASRLGQVLRMLGKRREAEHQTRAAREAFQSTSDLVLDTETGLELATLRAERGDVAGARHLLDETMRRCRSLGLNHLLPRAMRLSLQIATIRNDPAEAAMALPNIHTESDPEAAAALVRWYRSRGDVDQALSVPGVPTGFGGISWQIERARALLVQGAFDAAAREAEAARHAAETLGYAELELYASLLAGAARPTSEAKWQDLLKRAATSLYTEVFLGALELDARRLHAQGDGATARARWQTLRARSEELGYRPGVEEAAGWLAQ